jgi:hypothetical protein
MSGAFPRVFVPVSDSDDEQIPEQKVGHEEKIPDIVDLSGEQDEERFDYEGMTSSFRQCVSDARLWAAEVIFCLS